MRLPMSFRGLHTLTREQILAAIYERRIAIRSHRDQVGDDRCAFDDYLVSEMIEDGSEAPKCPLSFDEGMSICFNFYYTRRTETPDPIPSDAILDPAHWDDDLDSAGWWKLMGLLIELQRYIKDWDNRPRSVKSDRVLYSVLPEKISANFCLPPKEEFLGEAKAPHAGCPSFWRSHNGCCPECCNLHQWGPCACSCPAVA